jgi:peptidoglycan/LPS O-acetylase OafA/YrhL
VTTAPAPSPRALPQIVGIQYLRGVAAMMVAVFHLSSQMPRMGYDGPWLPGLSSGVDIFFVISGFIMWVTTSGRPVTPIAFWRRRIVRIVPLYWLVTTLMVVLMFVAPHALQSSRFAAAHVVSSYFFLPAPHPVTHGLDPVVVPGWTLNYEMFFYLVFGLFLFAGPRLRFWGTIGALLLLVGIGLAAGFAPLSRAGFYTSSIMLEFATGMVLGLAATRGTVFPRFAPALSWVLLVGGLIAVVALPGLADGDASRFLVRGIAATAVVAGMLGLEARGKVRSMPSLTLLGDASYSLYLSHVVTLSVVSQAWRKLHLDRLPGAVPLFVIVALLAAAAVGILCYLYVERPLTDLVSPRRRPAPVREPQAA